MLNKIIATTPLTTRNRAKTFKKPTLYRSQSSAQTAINNMHFTSDLVLKIDRSVVRGEGYYIGVYTTRDIFIQYL